MNQSEVFVSYAWGGESEKIVRELEESLENQGLTFIRDKRDLGFKGLITDFMIRIGTGEAVVVVISDKYLKSPYCMFELLVIYRNHDFVERVFPIFLKDAAIINPITRVQYAEYWEEKKTELERVIKKYGPKTIPVIGDDYNNYNKIVGNFGEVANLLKDINALTPEMHQASNFHQLHQALLQRLDEDSGHTKQKEIQKLLKQLFTGSQKYYEELTGINGPYHHLNITEEILAGINKTNTVEPTTIRLQTPVKNNQGEEFSLENCLQELWFKKKPHMILLGDGGMGKTVSLIHFWETLLKNNPKDGEQTIPLFLSLHEFNTISEVERSGFVAKRICWHYLGIKEDRRDTIDLLWNTFNTALENVKPTIVLLLDGFNEVTVDPADKRHLLLELQELRQKSKIVQMVLTSRYEMNFTWAEGFQTLEMQPLGEENVKAYLQERQVSYPEDQSYEKSCKIP